MKVYLIGAGCGPETLTRESCRALAAASLIVGAGRLLRSLPADCIHSGARRVEAVAPREILKEIERTGGESACVLLSGDSGFYSGAKRLLPLLADHAVTVLPGISSLQLLSARLGRPWQDWSLCSAHGVDCDPVEAVCGGKPCFFLTGGRVGPEELCARLRDAGLGALPVTVGENLGEPEEQICSGSAAEFAQRQFSPLSVLFTEAAPRFPRRSPGLPDTLFQREEKIPMTKQEVRAAALSRLAVGPEDLCSYIGAGTGSVSVELAQQSRAVWAVERSGAALALAEKNREQFGAWNLRLLQGEAPEILAQLPKPDAVFIGGSGGRMREILRAVSAANPKARVCAAAVALESLHAACEELEVLGYTVEVTQLAVSRSRAVGPLHMMTAQNPVYLVLGVRP